MKKEWNNQIACVNRVACGPCRRDARYQMQIARFYDVPDNWPECPHGVTIDNIPQPLDLPGIKHDQPQSGKILSPGGRQRSDICPQAVRGCCGKPYTCRLGGGDCPNHKNLECEKLKKSSFGKN